MGYYGRKLFAIALLTVVLLLPERVPADTLPQDEPTPAIKSEAQLKGLDLAQIIPESVKLSGRLTELQRDLKNVPDISLVENKCTVIGNQIKGLGDDLQVATDIQDYRTIKLIQLMQAVEVENKKLEALNKLLSIEIRKLASFRDTWLAKKGRWEEYSAFLSNENEVESARSAAAEAMGTIDSALDLVFPKLEAILALQKRVGDNQEEANLITANIQDLIMTKQRGAMLEDAPPMFSRLFLSQFRSELWLVIVDGLNSIKWPDSLFFVNRGWIVFLHIIIFLITVIVIRRNRSFFEGNENWRFLAARPFSAGVFAGTAIAVPLYKYWGVPYTVELCYSVLMGVSFVRLSGVWIVALWKRRFIHGVISVFIISTMFSVIDLPLPLIRLFTVFVCIAGIYLFWKFDGQNRNAKFSTFFAVALRFGTLFLLSILVAEIFGKHGRAEYYFFSMLKSLAVVLAYTFYARMVYGVLEWLLRSSPLGRIGLIQTNIESVIRQAGYLLSIIAVVLLFCMMFVIWGFFPSLESLLKGFWSIGFTIGSQQFYVGLLFVSAAILYGSFLLSWLLQKVVVGKMLSRQRVELGVRASIERLVHYGIIVVGFLWAVSILGFGITKLTIILGALGVGIGFGLQSIANNFVSGIIMLFERPVRVGDWIELGGQWAEIKSIGLRATIIETFNKAEMIIPNTDLIINPVTNWTLTNRQGRIVIPVGVAYGSNVSLVFETLLNCAGSNPRIAESPEPEVLFTKFGDNSLDFELRAWMWDIRERLTTKSELLREIDRRFREAKIEIAFPQRDLHLRSVDESAVSLLRKSGEVRSISE